MGPLLREANDTVSPSDPVEVTEGTWSLRTRGVLILQLREDTLSIQFGLLINLDLNFAGMELGMH